MALVLRDYRVMRRLWQLLVSVRLAAVLLAVMAGLLVLSFLVPQTPIMGEESMLTFWASLPSWLAAVLRLLQIDRIFTSWWFFAMMALLALNLIACTVQRIGRRRAVSRRQVGAVPPSAVRYLVPLSPADATAGLLESERSARRTQRDGATILRIRRGDAGFIGSVVMHLGLVLVMVGGIISGLTTFRGEMVLTEGQSVTDGQDAYLTIGALPRIGPAFGDFTVGLSEMDMTYEAGTVTDAVATMQVQDSAGSREELARVNYPLKVQGRSFLLQESGHSVQLSVMSPEGDIPFDSFLTLKTQTERGYSDSVAVGDVVIRLTSRPDASVPLDRPVADALTLVDPCVVVEVYKDAALLGTAVLRPGQGEQFAGYTVVAGDVRLWTRFLVRGDRGLPVVYLAFVLAIVGTVVRFLDPDRYCTVVVEPHADGAMLSLWGRSRYSQLPGREHRAVLERISGMGGKETA